MQRITHSCLLVAAALSVTLLAGGCEVQVGTHHDPYAPAAVVSGPLGDLEVSWTVDGDDRAGLCDYYGISHWTVQVRGPEARDVLVDCMTSYWSTGSDLYDLTEGTYSITLQAFDTYGATMLVHTTSYPVYADGRVAQVAFPLSGSDFYRW